jgi:hypothetical protein
MGYCNSIAYTCLSKTATFAETLFPAFATSNEIDKDEFLPSFLQKKTANDVNAKLIKKIANTAHFNHGRLHAPHENPTARHLHNPSPTTTFQISSLILPKPI